MEQIKYLCHASCINEELLQQDFQVKVNTNLSFCLNFNLILMGFSKFLFMNCHITKDFNYIRCNVNVKLTKRTR